MPEQTKNVSLAKKFLRTTLKKELETAVKGVRFGDREKALTKIVNAASDGKVLENSGYPSAKSVDVKALVHVLDPEEMSAVNTLIQAGVLDNGPSTGF